MKATFDKNAYLMNEKATITCEIDNSNCEIDMSHLKFVLKTKVILTSNSGRTKCVSYKINKAS
jgi:hypothetical protein